MINQFMSRALELAAHAGEVDEVPVGAVITYQGEIIAEAHNLTEARHDPTAHAEILAIQAACTKLGSTRLPECDLFVTLEPCTMCAAAISFARIRTLTFGAYDPKGGGVEHGGRFFQQSTCHHAPEVIGGTQEQECASLLTRFFACKRS